MKIEVRVRPGARRQKIEKLAEGVLKVWVTEPPEGNKANEAVVRHLAAYYNVPLSHIRLLAGSSSRHKIVAVDSNLREG